MDFADYILADTITKVRIVRKNLVNAGILPSGENIQLGLEVLNQFDEYTTSRKDKPINSIQVDLEIYNKQFNRKMKETQNVINETAGAAERFDKAIDKINAKLSSDDFVSADKLIDKTSKKLPERWN
jgi:ribosomal protein L11